MYLETLKTYTEEAIINDCHNLFYPGGTRSRSGSIEKNLKFDEEKLGRQLNVGFSGGEKKKNEILQMKILDPNLIILDETDSGLDIDALKIISDGVNSSRSEKKSFLVITHYQRLLEYIKPDHVHVLSDGKIIKSGTSELALELEKKGYKKLN